MKREMIKRNVVMALHTRKCQENKKIRDKEIERLLSILEKQKKAEAKQQQIKDADIKQRLKTKKDVPSLRRKLAYKIGSRQKKITFKM